MKILEYILDHDEYSRDEDIQLSPSEIGGSSLYQIYLRRNNTPEIMTQSLETNVNRVVGTAFHEYASRVLKESNLQVHSELQLKGEISGVLVGGTADVIYNYKNTYVVGDFKTVGSYQMKKAMRENFKSYLPQLSIYSYLYSQSLGVEYSQLGEIYMIHTGDAGYLAKKDGGGKLPKYLTETVDLMEKHEVEDLVGLVWEATETEPQLDCESWRCNYCSFRCPYRMNH